MVHSITSLRGDAVYHLFSEVTEEEKVRVVVYFNNTSLHHLLWKEFDNPTSGCAYFWNVPFSCKSKKTCLTTLQLTTNFTFSHGSTSLLSTEQKMNNFQQDFFKCSNALTLHSGTFTLTKSIGISNPIIASIIHSVLYVVFGWLNKNHSGRAYFQQLLEPVLNTLTFVLNKTFCCFIRRAQMGEGDALNVAVLGNPNSCHLFECF